MLVQGKLAAQDPAVQNSLAGETGMAFAVAVDEAGAQGGIKGMAGGKAQGGPDAITGALTQIEPADNDKKKLDLSQCLSGISALLAQGAYQIQQAADAAQAGKDTLANQSGSVMEEEGHGQTAGVHTSVSGGMAARAGCMAQPDMPGELTAMNTAKDTAPSYTAAEEVAKAAAGNAAPGQVQKAAKEKSDLDHTGFQNIQKPQAQGAVEAAQFMGNDSSREAVKTSSGDLEKNVLPIRTMAAAVKPDREKEKPVQLPAAGLAAAHRAAHALHAESTQSAADAAPENTVREENAAMQVARASVHALRRGMTEYRLRLSPEGLGDVEVTVVTKGKAVSLSMRTDNEAARGLILDHADELRAELNNQDYRVSGLSVEVGMDGGNGTGFFMPREHAGPAYDTGRLIYDREAADTAEDRGMQADTRRIMPRNSTISYRI